MNLPLVGLTSRLDTGEKTFSLKQGYCRAVAKAGGVPIMIPPILKEEAMAELLKSLDGLILTGGEDINPLLYGALPHPKLGEVDTRRDQFEIALCRAWLTTGKPLLGICRGMQLLNVVAGGGLTQDIASERATAMRHVHQGPGSDPAHPVEIASGSLLERLLGLPRGDKPSTLTVNSTHHQAIESVGKGFRVSSTAPDGVIEGIEAEEGTTVLGVQWHPENLVDESPEQLALFASLVRAARRH